jgi:peptidoglycan/LPS O-acetylase OafA/YrhL
MEPSLQKLSSRLHELDLLRFLAALSVVLYHYTYRDFMAGAYSPLQFVALGHFTKYGYLGVALFFIISGYVVLRSAVGKTVRQFFIARATRLYPAFWAACTLTFLVKRLWGQGPADAHMSVYLQAGFHQYAYNMTMLFDFINTLSLDGVYWSLTIELTFYFLISLLLAGGRLLERLDLFLTLWIGYVTLDSLGIMAKSTLLTALLVPKYAPYFIAGMLFYLLQQPHGHTWRRYCLLAASYLLALWAGMQEARELTIFFHDPISSLVAGSIITSFFGLFFLLIQRKSSLQQLGWLPGLGALTYPLYLVHNDIGCIAFHRLGHLINKYLLLSSILLLMLVVSYLIHLLVEKPLRQPLASLLAKWLSLPNSF